MKKILKKIILIVMASVLVTSGLAACGGQPADDAPEEGEDKLSVVTTIFPLYDWAVNIAGENSEADITLLLDSGVDLHSFQPTAEDIQKIADCDVFIYVGGESDEWVTEALGSTENSDRIVLNLMDVLGDRAREEEVVEGMQAEEHEHDEAAEHEHDEDAEHEHDEAAEHEHDEDAEHEHDEEGPEYDEHIWLSLKNAALLCPAVSDALAKADPDNAESYTSNCEAYVKQISGLDAKYQEAVEAASVNTLLFGDRFPFRYMTDDYGLDYYAAFVGCSAETEASFETIAFLAKKLDELALKHVMVIEGSDKKIAESIIASSSDKGRDILVLDSLQSVTAEDVSSGASYLAVMESNLEVLKEALR